MSIESILLVSNYTNDNSNTVPADFSYSDKQKGAGYHSRYGSLHTAIFEFDEFKGSVKLQGTLALYPGDNDWVDIVYNDLGTQLDALDSTPLVSTATRNFTGNFVWIRAAYKLEQGVITQIRYNY